MSAGDPQVYIGYLPKKTHRSCTCGSRSKLSHRSKQIWVAMSEFCRYLQVPTGYWFLPSDWFFGPTRLHILKF